MIDWLREELEKCLAEHPRTQWTAITPYAFINWLERTGATPWRSVEDDSRPKDGQFIGLLFDEGDGSRSMQGWTYSAGDMIAWPVCGASYWTPIPPLPKEDNDD